MAKHLVGDLKPHKIRERRVTDRSVNLTLAGIKSKKHLPVKVPK